MLFEVFESSVVEGEDEVSVLSSFWFDPSSLDAVGEGEEEEEDAPPESSSSLSPELLPPLELPYFALRSTAVN